ncbi:putative MarR family transcriptional regulator [Actinacidiphila reveromycinica]|uniref:Putative MarR family transcriptional regulator n=1 Tax=Actinacidiphila reveromycinica TaxID=659352 RepID=A0A7U3UZN6_9ACTN|nr:MarR family transcriptional regulator [Streptomyces sp. SN-593]BBB01539.1 putative MarR family transcriptional regulator [Streptomyces sp. SN-593]
MDTAHDMPLPDDRTATPRRLAALPSRLLNLTAAQGERMISGRLAEADARKWHYAVLAALEEYGPASQATLSRRTGIYRSDLVAVINELEARGTVRRAPDPDDRRRNVVTLTPAGRTQLDRLDAVLGAVQDDLLAPLSGPERAELTSLLARLVAHHAALREGEGAGTGR